jgi:hypothetical protein
MTFYGQSEKRLNTLFCYSFGSSIHPQVQHQSLFIESGAGWDFNINLLVFILLLLAPYIKVLDENEEY